MLWNQVELVLLCWGNIEKTFLDPSDGKNALGSDKKVGAAFLSFLNFGAAKLFSQAGDCTELTVFTSLTRCHVRLGIHTLGSSLSCFLTYIEALQYPKSAKTCKVQAGLECCISNKGQHYSFRRDILPPVSVSFLLLLMGAAKEGG